MKFNTRSLIIYILIFLCFLLMVKVVTDRSDDLANKPYSYSDFREDMETENIDKIDLIPNSDVSETGKADIYFKNETKRTMQVNDFKSFSTDVKAKSSEHGFLVYDKEAPKPSILVELLVPAITMILTLVFFMFVLQQMQGGSGGNRVMSFGKNKAKMVVDSKNKVTFSSVAGLDEEKLELQEIVDFLKKPKKYMDIGARIPKGVLLVGPPGTGKTLLARAVAGEADVPFLTISGSDFVEMFVGVGASRVRDLFEQAKKNTPCIIFIDEIDAVGRRRGAGLGGGHDEREQTLNQLLVEMDGFGINEGVIILAATNRPDILDPALLRPGRFDRQVVVGAPDVKGREEILKVHSKGKLLDPDIDFKTIAMTTPGFTGADLENLMNEAALMSARHNKKAIDMEEIRRAFIKVGIGTEKKSRVISKKERKITAYHEVGHAILQEVLPELDIVHIISVIPTGSAGGYTMHLPSEDNMYLTKKYMEESIVSLLGGRAAEKIIIEDISTGASNDIERATALARSMVTKYGMSDVLGPIQFGENTGEVFIGREMGHSRNYSEEVAATIDKEIKKIIENAYNKALEVLELHISILHKGAELLIEKEKITGEEFRRLFPDGILPEKENSVQINFLNPAEQ